MNLQFVAIRTNTHEKGAIPYAFRVGSRGAIGGVAIGLALGIAYWSLARLLQAMGGVGQMPPPFAAFASPANGFFSCARRATAVTAYAIIKAHPKRRAKLHSCPHGFPRPNSVLGMDMVSLCPLGLIMSDRAAIAFH